MKANEAKKLADGRSYADYALEKVLSSVKQRALMGYTWTSYMFTGADAISEDEYMKLQKKLEDLGYYVSGNPANMIVDWTETRK